MLSGGSGFGLHHALRPPDIAESRAAAERERQAHQSRMRDQVRGPARVEVDCALPLGQYLRPEKFQSIATNMAHPETVAAARQHLGPMSFARAFRCFRTEFLLHGVDWRPAEGDPEDARLANMASAFEQVMFPLPTVQARAMLDGQLAEEEYVTRLAAGLLHVRTVAPNARWVEVFNESEVGDDAMSDASYYRCYRAAYRAVNRVNAQRPDLPPMLVGGPSPCAFKQVRICSLLDQFVADPDSAKRLDFVAYHQYLFGQEHQPAMVKEELATLRWWLRERGISETLPVHVTETGIFPTRNGTERFAEDLLTQAVGVLSLHYWYVEQGPGIYPYQWTWFHANPRKNMFVPTIERLDHQRDSSSGPNDAIRAFVRPACDERPDRFTPFGNANRLQARLGAERLGAKASPLNDEGLGLYALAARDADRLTVLLWNYQFTRYEDPQDYEVTVTLEALGHLCDGQPVDATLTRIDRAHGNYVVGTESMGHQVCHRVVLDDRGTGRLELSLPQNTICLIELPVIRASTHANPPA